MCPLDLVITARRIPDYGAARSPQDDRIDFIGVGRIAPERGRNQRSAGVHEGTGRGTVACRKERPNRPRKEDRNPRASRTTLPENNGKASTQPGNDAHKARSHGPRRASANTQETKPCPSDTIRRDHLLTTKALSGKETRTDYGRLSNFDGRPDFPGRSLRPTVRSRRSTNVALPKG